MSKKKTPYQAHMSRQLKGKMKGKSKSQRKAMFKAAAKSWKKGSKSPRRSGSKSKSGQTRRTTATRSTGVFRRMGKKKPIFSTQKIFPLIRIGALALPAAEIIMSPGTPAQKLVRLKRDYLGTGTDGVFRLEYAAKGWMPFIFANVVTYGIPKLMSIIRRF